MTNSNDQPIELQQNPFVGELLTKLADLQCRPPMLVEESHGLSLRLRGPGSRNIPAGVMLALMRSDNGRDTGGYGYTVDADGITTIQILGAITPLQYAWGDGTESITEFLQRDVVAATADPQVRAVMFDVNSPGGYVLAGFELHEAIAALAAAKPTATFVSGVCASLAYLEASPTGSITAYKTASIGSIGTKATYVDSHRMLQMAGIEVVSVGTGAFKSAGQFGTKITDEQRSYFQERADKLNDFFLQAVTDGRRMTPTQLAAASDGRVHVAADAVKMKLVDSVGTMDSAMAALKAKVAAAPASRTIAAFRPVRVAASLTDSPANASANGEGDEQRLADAMTTDSPAAAEADGTVPEPPATPPAQAKEGTMPDPVKEPAAEQPKPATVKELKAEFADDAEFALEAADEGWTMLQAQAEYGKRLKKQMAEQKKADADKAKSDAAKAEKEKAEQPPAGGRGSKPVASGRAKRSDDDDGESGDPVADYNAAVEKQMAKPGFKGDRKKAVAEVNRTQRDLHRSYLEATNTGRKARELIADKFEGR